MNLKKIVASDINPLSIKTARTNAELHSRNNIEIFSSNASQIIAKGFNKLQPGKTTLILDPPRTG